MIHDRNKEVYCRASIITNLLLLSSFLTSTLALTTTLPFSRFQPTSSVKCLHESRSKSEKISTPTEETTSEEIRTKTIHSRSFHRLKEDDSDVLNPTALEIEERSMIIVPEDIDERHLSRYAVDRQKLLILRNYDKKEEFFRFRIRENPKKDFVCSKCDIASILYLAAEESDLVFKKRVIQLDCELGLMGLLGSIAVGKFTEEYEGRDFNQYVDGFDVKEFLGDNYENNPIITNKAKTNPIYDPEKQNNSQNIPLPPYLDSLTLSSSHEEEIDIVLEHLKRFGDNESFGWSKFDWHLTPRVNPVKPFYGGILLNSNKEDIQNAANQFSYAKELARTVAKYLEPQGVFLQIIQQDKRDYVNEEPNLFHDFLQKGYRMGIDERPFTMESCLYESQTTREDTDQLGPWKEGRTTYTKFVGVLGNHCGDYNGLNGDFVFPAENGTY